MQRIKAVQRRLATNWTGVCEELAKISDPTLVITGTIGVIVPTANSLITVGKIPGVWLVHIRDGRHVSPSQYPVNRVLQTFLSTTTGSGISYLVTASTLPLSVSSSHLFSGPAFILQFNMGCKNLCEKLYSKIVFGKSRYEGGKKYCRRCEVYYYHQGTFCTCCGMALRMSPTSRRDKEKLRQLRLKEQDRIIRIIKRLKT
ncbi:MAG TPA: hypothetical protein VFI73_11275 [Candidatus Nitrosopolaris sp.]|nr:hypothetical protein [Candidatus Nitrosopolaris sp.]